VVTSCSRNINAPELASRPFYITSINILQSTASQTKPQTPSPHSLKTSYRHAKHTAPPQTAHATHLPPPLPPPRTHLHHQSPRLLQPRSHLVRPRPVRQSKRLLQLRLHRSRLPRSRRHVHPRNRNDILLQRRKCACRLRDVELEQREDAEHLVWAVFIGL
jgi:hypothetical protein